LLASHNAHQFLATQKIAFYVRASVKSAVSVFKEAHIDPEISMRYLEFYFALKNYNIKKNYETLCINVTD
jgi:hypothetical protein